MRICISEDAYNCHWMLQELKKARSRAYSAMPSSKSIYFVSQRGIQAADPRERRVDLEARPAPASSGTRSASHAAMQLLQSTRSKAAPSGTHWSGSPLPLPGSTRLRTS
ncbi:unnamed protein product [Phaeothamnion confervicola]